MISAGLRCGRALALSLLLVGSAHAVGTATLNFSYDHGTVMSEQYFNSTVGDFDYGITISATGGPNTAIVYDSELAGTAGGSIDGEDPDLERLVNGSPGGDSNSGGWDGGNLGSDYIAGGLLIVQENPAEASNPTIGTGPDAVTSASLFNPDDRAGSGASTLVFTIDAAYTYNYFSLILADLEESADSWQITLTGFDEGSGAPTDSFLLGDLIALDPTITQGNNFINQLPPTQLLAPAVTRLAEVEINFGSSSGAISAIVFSETVIPEPGNLSLIGVSLLLFTLRRKRKA